MGFRYRNKNVNLSTANALGVFFNNLKSKLKSTNVQDAIDEVKEITDELNSNLEWKYLGSVTGSGSVDSNFVSIEGYKEIHIVFYNETYSSTISGLCMTLPNLGINSEVPINARRVGFYQNDESYAYACPYVDYGNQKVYMGSYAVYAKGKNVTTTTAIYVYGR